MTIRLSLTILPVLALLLCGCAATGPAPVTSAAVKTPPLQNEVTFASALRDLPEREAVQKLLIANERANDTVTRRRDYKSAAGQPCTMLELINKADAATSLVACQSAQGGWNVRPAFGDMNVSIKMPPPSDPVQNTKTADAAPTARHIVALQRPVVTETTIQPAMIEAPVVKAQPESIQYKDPVHMSPAPNTPAVAMPADWPTPDALRHKTTPVVTAPPPAAAPSDVLWKPRHSRTITLSHSAIPAPLMEKASVQLASASRSGL